MIASVWSNPHARTIPAIIQGGGGATVWIILSPNLSEVKSKNGLPNLVRANTCDNAYSRSVARPT